MRILLLTSIDLCPAKVSKEQIVQERREWRSRDSGARWRIVWGQGAVTKHEATSRANSSTTN